MVLPGQLTLHVDKGNLQRLCPAEDVVYNDIGVCILVNQGTIRLSKLLSGAIGIMNKCNVRCRPIHRAKRHDFIGLLGGIGSGKG
jgi:hypothetical protein